MHEPKSKMILLVEDSADDRALTLRALKKNHVLNEVITVNDGVEALDYLFCKGPYANRDKHAMPAVVLLDLKLPKLTGIQVLQRLRAEEKTKYLPVVILTSSKEEQDLVNGYKFGANSYIRKPVDFAQFNEALNNLGMYWLVLNEVPPTS